MMDPYKARKTSKTVGEKNPTSGEQSRRRIPITLNFLEFQIH
jgi:hypothetical protein